VNNDGGCSAANHFTLYFEMLRVANSQLQLVLLIVLANPIFPMNEIR